MCYSVRWGDPYWAVSDDVEYFRYFGVDACRLFCLYVYSKTPNSVMDITSFGSIFCSVLCCVGIFISMKKYGKWIAAAVVLLMALLSFIIQKVSSPYGSDGTLVFDDPTQPYIKVHVLDVGQADAIIVELPGHRAMMIDAGTSDSFGEIKAYLDMLAIKKIDYMVGTHPHEDHIGSLRKIMGVFSIGKLYMPNVEDAPMQEIRLDAEERDIPVCDAKAGIVLLDEEDLRVEILAPNREAYEDMNDSSVVVKITYMNNRFLFAGDATMLSEKEMLLHQADLDADVLKIAHHGADTSTGDEFLAAVSPKYAIISLEENNHYGFPDPTVSERLAKNDVKVYRTDLNGTVIFFGNGQRIGVKTEK